MKLKVASVLGFILCCYAFGNPEGSSVVSGDVDFQTDGLNLNITASDRSIIEWQDFSIDAGETTRFIQPNSSSAVLNQVKSNIPSSIYGNLLANGKVYLVNPNGIVIGASGVVDTGGFLATTLDQGTVNFFENGELGLLGDSDAAIVNMGNITATGDIFLVAAKIDNQGLIQSTNGFVGLAAGKDVLLKEAGEERIFIRPVGEGEIDISGSIEALNIEIKSRGNAYSTAINLEGQLTANKVNEVGGRIFLAADGGGINIGPQGSVIADGEITLVADNLDTADSSLILTTEDLLDDIGTVYLVDPSLILSSGDNLFNSFDQFDIVHNSSAIFVGSNNIANVLNRVTGGNSSVIGGVLDSDSSIYLVNPRGTFFENARSVNLSIINPFTDPVFSSIKGGQYFESRRILFVNDAESRGLLAKFSAQASDDSKSIINLDR